MLSLGFLICKGGRIRVSAEDCCANYVNYLGQQLESSSET